MLALDYLMKPVGSGELLQALCAPGLGKRRSDRSQNHPDRATTLGMLEMNARMCKELSRSPLLKANNGRAALEILSKVPVHLVLLRLMMPSGWFWRAGQMREWNQPAKQPYRADIEDAHRNGSWRA